MALAKKTTLDAITIRDNGVFEIRRKTTVDEDGAEIGSRFSRVVYEPGDDVSAEPARLRQITAIVWTPAVIAAFAAAKAAQAL